MKCLESFGYFSLSSILTVRALSLLLHLALTRPLSACGVQLYLTEDFGMSDVSAGVAYGLWGTLSTLYGLLLGRAIDAMGVRRALALSFTVSALAKLVIATTRSRTAVLLMLFGPLPAAGALGIPVLTIGIRRCTHTGNRGFAFGLFYTLMNCAALLSGLLVDAFRLGLKKGFDVPSLGPQSALNSGQRLLMLLGAATSFAGAGVALSMREGVRVSDKPPGEEGQPGNDAQAPPPPPPPSYRELLREPRLWKYMAMCLLTVNLKSIFRHLDATLPKYLIRAFGCSAPIGSIYSINPAMIIILVPLVSAATTSVRPFDMIRHGGWLSALSPLWLALFQSYGAAVMFIVMLSLGEAAWSPRWYDYTMAVAPEGREGAYTALAAAPLFLATLPTGMLSGELLNRFCPAAAEAGCKEGGHADPKAFCHGKPMWGIIAAATLLSPLCVTLFAPWLRPSEAHSAAALLPDDASEADSTFRETFPRGSAPGRLEALADALTGGFGALGEGLKRAVSRLALPHASASVEPASEGLPGLLGPGLLGDEDDDWGAPDDGPGLDAPLLLRSPGVTERQ